MKRMFPAMVAILITLCSFTQQKWSAKETARKMVPGWNLGNTLEAGNKAHNFTNQGIETETWWQPTRTTQEVIDYVKQQGFKSIRIPCAWVMGHISDKETYTIDPTWMARVKQVVDYCIQADLYVVLNQHWDGGWLENHIEDSDSAVIKENKQILHTIWKQIATAFKDYDEHLLFAGLNEPNAGTAEATQRLVEYEQVFVDAVRATGGNNAKRVLIVQGPNTDIDTTAKLMKKLPVDVVGDRLMLEVHYYAPWPFAGMEKDEEWSNMAYYWGADNHLTGSKRNATWGEETTMCALLDKMLPFVQQGVPVYIGEFGALWRDLSGEIGENQVKHNASIKHFFSTFTKESMKRGFVPVVWDHNKCSFPNMTLFDRSKPEIFNTPVYEGIMTSIK